MSPPEGGSAGASSVSSDDGGCLVTDGASARTSTWEQKWEGKLTKVAPNTAALKEHDGKKFKTVVLMVDENKVDVTGLLSSIMAALQPGGTLTIVLGDDAARSAELETQMMFAGFVDGTRKNTEMGKCYEANKPQWELGASAAVKVPTVAVPLGDVKKAWKIMADDTAEDDLVDDDDLLAADGGLVLPQPTKNADAGGCATKKRACKDCSCGRAELEAAEGGPVDVPSSSACGNCFKGDAFRCATCPFLGKPAFEKGQEKVVLVSLDDQLDA